VLYREHFAKGDGGRVGVFEGQLKAEERAAAPGRDDNRGTVRANPFGVDPAGSG